MYFIGLEVKSFSTYVSTPCYYGKRSYRGSDRNRNHCDDHGWVFEFKGYEQTRY